MAYENINQLAVLLHHMIYDFVYMIFLLSDYLSLSKLILLLYQLFVINFEQSQNVCIQLFKILD